LVTESVVIAPSATNPVPTGSANIQREARTMKNRMLPKAALVVAMGAIALLTPKRAVATAASGACYVCYRMDGCPDQDVGDAICAQNTSCTTMTGCMELAGEDCLQYPSSYVEVYCQ
jgi:hypothetical protein